LIRSIYKIFNLFLILSTVLSGWTAIILFSNTTYNTEIKEVINKIYFNQKNFLFNVKDLSVLLLKDANRRFYDEENYYK